MQLSLFGGTFLHLAEDGTPVSAFDVLASLDQEQGSNDPRLAVNRLPRAVLRGS
ncbi:hypothetical protein ACMHYB_21205 [Sorangium sp. So ce1128]